MDSPRDLSKQHNQPQFPGQPKCPICQNYSQVSKVDTKVKRGWMASPYKVTRWYCSDCRTEWPLGDGESAHRGCITDSELQDKEAAAQEAKKAKKNK